VLGVETFLLVYALGILEHGYEASPLEAIAYKLQNEFEEGENSGGLFSTVVSHAQDLSDRAAAVFAKHGLRFQ
jgi:hypothetical protein